MLNVVFLLIGLGLGFAIAWFYFKNQTVASVSADDISKMQQANQDMQLLVIAADRDKAVLQEKIHSSEKQITNLTSDYKEEQNKLAAANNRLAKAEEAFGNMKDKLASQKLEFEELQKRFTTEFENIANKILDEKSKKFVEQNKTNLDTILNPFKERIKEFQDKVDQTHKADSNERSTLKAEIKNLMELNNRISLEANNLAAALKGDNKKQGNWGEVILEKILERSGLRKGIEYETQLTTTNIDGSTIKPDVIINLPEDKHVVIDSKVSLLAYDAYVNSESEEDRERHIKEHILSVKTHIKILSDKNYQTSALFNTPDFVLLFIPIESMFSIAVQADQDLFNYAWERKIVIVSPSTLLATLRTISSIWKQERQNKNALEIARIGGSLYDGFCRFLEDMRDIEKNLLRSQEAYGNAFRHLSQGKGNLIHTAEKIKTLGAKATKSIDKDLVENANDPSNQLTENNT